MNTVVAVGDSISNGWGMPTPGVSCWPWPARVAESLGWPILNLAVNGAGLENMRDVQLPLLPDQIDIATVMMGTNDVRATGLPNWYPDAAAQIIDRLSEVADVTLVATLPRQIRCRQRGHTAAVLAANEVARKVCIGRDGVLLVDAERAFDDAPALLGFDRIHLTGAGHLRVARIALDALTTRGMHPERALPPSLGLGRVNRGLDLLGRVALRG